MKVFSVKGILLGFFVVAAIDIISGIGLIPIFAKDMSKESLEALSHSTEPLIYSLIFGSIGTVIGGYIAAKYGSVAPYKNSAVLGFVGIILGILLNSHYPLWFNVIGFTTTIPCALLGAFFIAKKNV